MHRAFACTLAARKLTAREGRLLKRMSGVMLLQWGMLLGLAPLGVVFTLLGVTWLVARPTRTS
ncbi:MAG TPA: hypothetical protein VK910_01045 [Thiobacillus sp.]|nr:hypothetical protein [Thiobacillus sp.]